MAAEGEKVVIKDQNGFKVGSMLKEMWKCTLPNSFFGDFNPYKEEIW